MPAGSHSFAEVLQGRRRSGLFGQPPQINWSSKSKGTDLRKVARDIPAAGHASEDTPRITAHEATRSGSNVGSTSRRCSMRAAEQLHPSSNQVEKRLSEASVITQVRAPSSRYSISSNPTERTSCYQPESGQTTPRPHTAGAGQTEHQSTDESLAQRPHTAMPTRSRPTTREEQAAMKAADADYHAALRRMEGQDPIVKKSNKLEKMFGDQIPAVGNTRPSRRKERSFDLMKDDIADELPADEDVPPIPPKSLRRPSIRHAPPQTTQHRPSNSISRSVHNSSVASTSNQDSDLTNPDSDVFSDDDGDASSFTSGLSSTTDELERRKIEAKTHGTAPAPAPAPAPALTPAPTPVPAPAPAGYASEGEHASALRVNTKAASTTLFRHNQQAPSPPDAISCYDMLAMRSPAGVERTDFGASRVPDLAKASTSILLAGTTMETHILDLSRRPPSPALSDVSDTESYDSACPPPVSLHRDHHGPKFRSREEQKRAYKPRSQTPTNSSPAASSTALSKVKSSSKTSVSAVDLSVRPSQFAARSGSVVSASSDYAGNGERQGAGFSFSRLFSRKKNSQPEQKPALAPLRKITFDSRGQKQVIDLNGSQRDISQFLLSDSFASVKDGSRSRAYSGDTRRSASSMTNRSNNNGQGSWRIREPGAPRRTAWK